MNIKWRWDFAKSVQGQRSLNNLHIKVVNNLNKSMDGNVKIAERYGLNKMRFIWVSVFLGQLLKLHEIYIKSIFKITCFVVQNTIIQLVISPEKIFTLFFVGHFYLSFDTRKMKFVWRHTRNELSFSEVKFSGDLSALAFPLQVDAFWLLVRWFLWLWYACDFENQFRVWNRNCQVQFLLLAFFANVQVYRLF